MHIFHSEILEWLRDYGFVVVGVVIIGILDI